MAEIQGHEDVLAMLQALNADDGKKVARTGLRAAAKVVLPVVKELAAKHRKSGKMDANLKIRSGGGGKGLVRVKVGAGKKDFQGPAFYTPAVLFGHHVGKRPTTRAGRRALKLNDTRPFVKGDDFIEQAQHQTEGAAIQAMSDSVLQQVAKIQANPKSA